MKSSLQAGQRQQIEQLITIASQIFSLESQNHSTVAYSLLSFSSSSSRSNPKFNELFARAKIGDAKAQYEVGYSYQIG